jgi:hypothetical protein
MKSTNFFRRTIMTRPLYKRNYPTFGREPSVKKGAGDSTERSELGRSGIRISLYFTYYQTFTLHNKKPLCKGGVI